MLQESIAQVPVLGMTKNSDMLRGHWCGENCRKSGLSHFLASCMPAEDGALPSQRPDSSTQGPASRLSPSMFVMAAFVCRSCGGWLHMWPHTDASRHTACASTPPAAYTHQLALQERKEPWVEDAQAARMMRVPASPFFCYADIPEDVWNKHLLKRHRSQRQPRCLCP